MNGIASSGCAVRRLEKRTFSLCANLPTMSSVQFRVTHTNARWRVSVGGRNQPAGPEARSSRTRSGFAEFQRDLFTDESREHKGRKGGANDAPTDKRKTDPRLILRIYPQ